MIGALDGKVVVIIGGAGLLGRAFCSSVAEAGAVVAVADLNLAAAKKVAAALQELGHAAEAVEIDIGDAASIDNAVADIARRHGRIDAVVNSAYPRNASYGRRLEAVSYADFTENVALNLGGYFLVAQRFALYFREAKKGGNIVNLGSIYGSIAPRFSVYHGTEMTMPVEYAAIKSGIAHLTRYFAQYFKADGIRVNTLSPGGVLDRQPGTFVAAYNSLSGKKGMLDPGDLAGTLVYLLSDQSSFMTGQNLIIDDGFSL